MDLESVVQSQVSQKEKNKYSCIYVESRKMVQMNLSVGQKKRCRPREQRGERGETKRDTKRGKRGGMNWAIGVDIYTLLHIK